MFSLEYRAKNQSIIIETITPSNLVITSDDKNKKIKTAGNKDNLFLFKKNKIVENKI